MKKRFLTLIILMFTSQLLLVADKQSPDKRNFDKLVKPFLNKYCSSCHGEKKKKGDIRVHDINFDLASSKDLEKWQLVLKQLQIGEMPPEKKPQPSKDTKEMVMAWITAEMDKSGHMNTFKQKMQKFHYGNYVDHEKLFSGEIKAKPFSPARLWRRNTYHFDIAKNTFFGESKNPRHKIGEVGYLKQPYNKGSGEGISDYAALFYADSATFDTLHRNAVFIVDRTLLMAFKEYDYKKQGKTMDAWKEDYAKILKTQADEIKEFEKLGKTTRYIRGKHRAMNAKYRLQTPQVYKDIILGDGKPTKAQIEAAIKHHFIRTIQQEATEKDLEKYSKFMVEGIKKSGPYFGLRNALIAILCSPKFIYRSELGLGAPVSDGRRMLSPVELAYAISYALTDRKPDEKLLSAVKNGKLKTRADVQNAVTRILLDEQIEKPRIIRFFQEFFGYHLAPEIFKDDKRFYKGYTFFNYAKKYVTETDVMINHILKKDKDVFKKLLTSEEYFVAHSGDNDEEKEMLDAYQKLFKHFKPLEWKKFNKTIPKEHMEFVRSLHPKLKHFNGRMLQSTMKHMLEAEKLGITSFAARDKIDRSNYLYAYNIPGRKFDFPVKQPFVLSKGKRAGILSHPSWLIAHSLNATTDPVRRGKWIRERLLAGTIPDVPITVDATVPEDHHKTLRERYHVTEAEECWKCHTKMNPLGYPFEIFDDFGRWRDQEVLEGLPKVNKKMQTKPVNAKGYLDGTGDKNLDGEVKDAIDLVSRLGKSRHVQQSIIRHAFRYWMGRNEFLTDSQTLIQAEKAYMDNGGSFKAMLVSLLTSDSFIYRKRLD